MINEENYISQGETQQIRDELERQENWNELVKLYRRYQRTRMVQNSRMSDADWERLEQDNDKDEEKHYEWYKSTHPEEFDDIV